MSLYCLYKRDDGKRFTPGAENTGFDSVSQNQARSNCGQTSLLLMTEIAQGGDTEAH